MFQTQVIEQADTLSIEIHIHKHCLRWAGHLIQLDDSRILKQMLYNWEV